MEGQPKLKVTLFATDWIIEIFAVVALLAIWIVVALNYGNLPTEIPTHYNGSGEADGYSHKNEIFALPIVTTIIFAAMTIINQFPHIFNYPTAITHENAAQQYKFMTRMIRFLKLSIAVIFLMIVLGTVATANEILKGLGKWFLPFVMALIFIPMLYFIIRLSREK